MTAHFLPTISPFTNSDLDHVAEILTTAARVHPSLERYLSPALAWSLTLHSTEHENDTILLCGYAIQRVLETRKTIAGDRHMQRCVLSAEVYDCGSHWEPPSADYVELGTYDSIMDAVLGALAQDYTESIENALAADAEARAIEEMDKYYNELQHSQALEDYDPLTERN